MLNLDQLKTLHGQAKKTGVSWSLNYEESCDTWYVTIESAAQGEGFVGKSRSDVYMAIEDALEHLLMIQCERISHES